MPDPDLLYLEYGEEELDVDLFGSDAEPEVSQDATGLDVNPAQPIASGSGSGSGSVPRQRVSPRPVLAGTARLNVSRRYAGGDNTVRVHLKTELDRGASRLWPCQVSWQRGDPDGLTGGAVLRCRGVADADGDRVQWYAQTPRGFGISGMQSILSSRTL
jgi:hypothetical protein